MADLLRGGAGIVAGALIASGALAAPGDVYNLGTLDGGESRGGKINASGKVAGIVHTPGGGTRAFRYTGIPGSGGMMHDLGSPGENTAGVSINASGQVVGIISAPNGTRAFRYTGIPGSAGVMHNLGTLGGLNSVALGINDIGQVVGWSDTGHFDGQGSGVSRAFVYTGTPGAGGVMQSLPTLGGTRTFGHGINDAGQVTGSGDTKGNVAHHAFLYVRASEGGVIRDLGSLGGKRSGGQAINASGQVAGYSYTGQLDAQGNPIQHAFLYTGTPGSGGVMHDLGTLGGTEAIGTAINGTGQVAGWSYIGPRDPQGGQIWRAFLYTGTPGVNGSMVNLDTWLDAVNPAEGAKWTLEQAYGVNDGGLITGNGIFDDGPGGLSDGRRAFILDGSALIPEPGSMSAMAVVGVLARRRRRSGGARFQGSRLLRPSSAEKPIHRSRLDLRAYGHAPA